MPTRSRTRLSPEDRRAMFLEVGAELFGSQPYDAVHLDEVALRAECSRALVYHYFPTKRALFVAVVEQVSDQILTTTQPDDDAAPLDRLRQGMNAYFAWAATHSLAYQAMYRQASVDPEIRQILRAGRGRQERRVLDGLPPEANQRADVHLIVRGWTAFVAHLCLDWLDEPGDVDAAALAGLCVTTLVSGLGAALRQASQAT